jgi:hypothetical protein
MAKKRHDETEESKAPLILMTAGGLAVAGLVAWALTRTVEPAPAAVAGGTPPALEQPVATPAAGLPATGDTATPSVLPTHEERTHVARISMEDAHAKFRRGEVTMVDVRDAGSYAAGHVKGAINIPFAQVESRLAEIPKGKPIVTYCT